MIDRPPSSLSGLPEGWSGEPPSPPDGEGRTFVGEDGALWWVTVLGETVTGYPPDRGAPLLLLRFRRHRGGGGKDSSGAPQIGWEVDEEWEERGELWGVGRTLEHLPESGLLELAGRVKPRR